MREMSNALEFRGVVKRYGSKAALCGVDLTVPDRGVFALLGTNGAGKTTSIRLATTLLSPDEGEITVLGLDTRHERERIRAQINISPQETAVAPNLTVAENLEFMAGVYGIAEKKLRARELCDEFGLEPVMNKRAKTLSGGWQRRVSIAMALVNRPRLLFLDEPTLGLDVIARREMWEIIRSLRKNATIILTTHYMEEAQELSDRIAILEGGVLAACGNAGELCELAGAKDLESAFVKLATGGRLK